MKISNSKLKVFYFKLSFFILIFTFSITWFPSETNAWYDSNYGYCRKLTMTAGGTSGGVATTTTAGFTLWATSTISSLAATSSSGRIQKYNYASSTPTDVAFTNGTDCNSDGGSAIDFTWDSYASTTGAFAVAIEAGDISSTTAKSVLMYYGYSADTTHENDTGTFGALGEQGVWSFGTTTTNWTALRAWDRTTNKNHGTLTSFPGPASTVPGMTGSALTFDGTNDFVNVPDTSSLDILTNFTISVWIKPTAAKESDVIDTTGFECGGYALWILPSMTPEFLRQCDAGSFATGGGALSTNTWYHLVGTKSGSTGTLYKNGVQVGQDTSFSDFANTGAKTIGKGQDGVFQGVIDDLRIYNRGLHAMDVLTIYNNTRSSTIFWTFGGEETEVPPENPPTVSHTGATTTISMSLSRPSNNIGLVGWWTFDGPDMISNVRDRSGQGNNGNLSGFTSTTTVLGKIGQALSFKGANDIVSFGNVFNFGTGDFTVSMWVKGPSTNTVFIEKRTACNADSTWIVGDGGDGFYYFWTQSDADANIHSLGIETMVPDVWQHVVFTRSGATIKGYTDGVLSATDIGAIANLSNSASTRMGKSACATPPNKSFDDVRIYSRALSAGEISTLYQTGTPVRISTSKAGGDSLKSGLVGWWTFDGPNMIPQVRDRSDQTLQGNLFHSGSGTTTAPGKLGQALYFDGVDDYVNFGDEEAFERTDSFSMSVWLKYNSSDPTTNGHIMGKRDPGGTNTGYALQNRGGTAGNPYRFSLANDAGSNAATIAFGGVSDIDWHLVTVTYNGTSNVSGMVAYIDGVVQSPTTVLNPVSSSILNAIDFTIGGQTSTGYHQGTIDDARVYNRVLSASEVLRLYNMGR